MHLRSPSEWLLLLLIGCELEASPAAAPKTSTISGSRNARRAWLEPEGQRDPVLLARKPCATPAADGGSIGRAVSAPTLLVTVAPSATGEESLAAEFSVSEVRELYVHSSYDEIYGAHRELRRFFAPTGDLYYEKLIAFSTELDTPERFDEQVATPHHGFVLPVTSDALVSDSFPLAGTWISDRGLTGTWSLNVHVDDSPQPSASLQFELVP